MKYLTLVRHAKSSWDHPELSDFERPLNERGQRDAPIMARRVKQLIGVPARFISSPALRAITTARIFAQQLDLDLQSILVRPQIYEASRETLLSVLQQLDDADGHVMLFGHNPGLSQLAHRLALCPFDDLPTCGVAHFSLRVKTWREAVANGGELLEWTYPKETRPR